MAWYVHWNSSFDLSRGGVELSFRNEDDMIHLLVETASIREVDSIIHNISGPNISSRYNVLGSRGLGKSTILNYFAYSLYKKIETLMVIPIHVTMFGTATDEKELEFIFFRSLLESLFEIPNDFSKFGDINKKSQIIGHLKNAYAEYTDSLKKHGDVSIEFVYTAFNYQVSCLKQYFNKIVFLFDGLDKQETELVMRFFRNTQERINYMINKYDCIFIHAADPTWRDSLETTEYSGVKGRSINLRGWTISEIDSLIRKRLERIGVYSMPFTESALQIIVENHLGNTRGILQYATTLLNFAAKEHIQNIGPGLAKDIIWDESAKETFYNKIQSEPNLRYAIEKIKIREMDLISDVENIFLDRQFLNILFMMYNQKNYRLSRDITYLNRSSLGITLSDEKFNVYLNILNRRGCIKRSIIEGYYELDIDMITLFDYVNELNQSLDALPVVLDSLSSRISSIPIKQREDLLIKEEIQDVFEQNADKWIDYDEIKQYLFENPRTLSKIQGYFKEKYVSNVNRVIPLMVSQLYIQGQVIIDAETSTYRWRSNLIDYDTAELFKDKYIINNIIDSQKAISQKKFIKFQLECKKLYLNILNKINEIYNNRFDVEDINTVYDLLNYLDINLQHPVPFKIVISALNKKPNDMDEAKIIYNNTILFAKRIQRKLLYLKSYSNKNNLKIEMLKTNTVGFSKQNERDLFNIKILPMLKENFSKIIESMISIKITNGYLNKIPQLKHPSKDIFLKAKLYKCEKCESEIPISGEDILANCPNDSTLLTYIKDVYIISQEIYQAWTVWIEEYVKFILKSLPIQYITSGITLKPGLSPEISIVEEIDGVILIDGKLIAIECIENLVTKEKSDVDNIVTKISNLKLFDAIILVYYKIDDLRLFTSQIGKYKNFVYPVQVKKPKTFKMAIYQIIKIINEKQ